MSGYGRRGLFRISTLLAWCVLLLAVALPLPAAADGSRAAPADGAGSGECSGDGVYLYGKAGHTGRCRKWTADDKNLTDDNLNDLASSIRFVGSYGGGRYTAILYEHAGFKGAWTAFAADDRDLANDSIGSDRASSIKIVAVPPCMGDGIYVYEHKNYGGRCYKFTADDPNLTDNAFNDVASSVKLAGKYSGERYEVTLCEHADYQGQCNHLTTNDANLGDNRVTHDRVSSIRIRAVKPRMCVPTSGSVTQRFAAHGALDIAGGAAPGSTPVYAAHKGRVVYVGPAQVSCNRAYAVAIRYDGDVDEKYVLTLYNHLGHWGNGKFTSYVKVKVGDHVARGQLIGYQGDAPLGMCPTSVTGVNLHLAVYERNKPFLDEYKTWGKRCERGDLFFELGGTSPGCALRHAAKAVDPEHPFYLGALGPTVTQSCKK